MRYVDPTGEFAIAIPLVVIGAEELGKALVAAVCTVIAYHVIKETSKTISQGITESKTKDKNPENYNRIQRPGRKKFIEDNGFPHPADPDQSI